MNINELKTLYSSGEELSFLYFWGKYNDGRRNYFSQWYPISFEVDGVKYKTAEHFMMIQKALLFKDSKTRDLMMNASGPQEVKKLGRSVINFDPVIWDQNKEDIVYRGNSAKFSQNKDFKEYILSTGDSILVEASPYDTIWGIGLPESDIRVHNPNEWHGLNLLGFTLMKVRDSLKFNTETEIASFFKP
jgi:ribA/ribD-fused uncharacterized protein